MTLKRDCISLFGRSKSNTQQGFPQICDCGDAIFFFFAFHNSLTDEIIENFKDNLTMTKLNFCKYSIKAAILFSTFSLEFFFAELSGRLPLPHNHNSAARQQHCWLSVDCGVFYLLSGQTGAPLSKKWCPPSYHVI